MRPGQNKRMRGRNPNNNSGGNRKGPNPLTRSYESNGPDVKIRGNAHHVAEKYLQLARDAQSSGDPVAAESYLQHAEHYFRLIASAQQAQLGNSRPPEEIDDGSDDDDGIPDRFASPQPPVPFVPQPPAPQPYNGERQPYAAERQPYADRQNNGGGERQPYAERQNVSGDRSQPPQDRNGYDRSQRQDRNGMGRNRPYRDNSDRGPDLRQADGGERQDRNRQNDRPRHERSPYDRSVQERGYRDPAADLPRDPAYSEQPRLDATDQASAAESATARSDATPRADASPRGDAVPRTETPRSDGPSSRSEMPVKATPVEPPARPSPSAAADDGSGLPSFITTPTRVVPTDVAASEPNLATSAPFPGDDVVDAPKFPRRRRRTTRASSEAAETAPSEGPTTGD